jgi:hypothetical protein
VKGRGELESGLLGPFRMLSLVNGGPRAEPPNSRSDLGTRSPYPHTAASTSTPAGQWSDPRTAGVMKAPFTKRMAAGEAKT